MLTTLDRKGLNKKLHLSTNFQLVRVFYRAGVHKSQAPTSQGNYILCSGAQYLWVLSVEFISCHPSRTYKNLRWLLDFL